MIDAKKLKELQERALEAVSDMPEGDLKTKAFEVFLQHLLNLDTVDKSKQVKQKKKPTLKGKKEVTKRSERALNLTEIVNLVKSCDEAEQIERQILDRVSQVDRTLLPLYIVYQHMENKYSLTSGEISKVTTDLGIPMATANISHTLSGTASKYVIGDAVRKKGKPVRYKLSRRGAKYIKTVIESSSIDK